MFVIRLITILNLMEDLRFPWQSRFKSRSEVFWVVIPYNVVVGYQHFGGTCCLYLQGNITWCHNPQDLNLHFTESTLQ